MLNILQVRILIILTCCLCLIFLANCQGVPLPEEAYYFAVSDKMIGFDINRAKEFAKDYSSKCNEVGRLNQEFYDNAYDVAHDSFKLGFEEEEQKKKFIVDFALSCKPKSLITPSSYVQIDKFTRDPNMMNLSDSDSNHQYAKAFIWNYLINCGKENYLTPNNWKMVYDYASNKLNLGVTDAEKHTKQFFRECK